jgi:hypothetical protein
MYPRGDFLNTYKCSAILVVAHEKMAFSVYYLPDMFFLKRREGGKGERRERVDIRYLWLRYQAHGSDKFQQSKGVICTVS